MNSSGCVDISKSLAGAVAVSESDHCFCQSVVSQIARTFRSAGPSATHNFSSEMRGLSPAFSKHRCIGAEARLPPGLASPANAILSCTLEQWAVNRDHQCLNAAAPRLCVFTGKMDYMAEVI